MELNRCRPALSDGRVVSVTPALSSGQIYLAVRLCEPEDKQQQEFQIVSNLFSDPFNQFTL